MEEQPKSWKEKKAARDAELRSRARRIFVPPKVPAGQLVRTPSGTVYRVAADGSFRRT